MRKVIKKRKAFVRRHRVALAMLGALGGVGSIVLALIYGAMGHPGLAWFVAGAALTATALGLRQLVISNDGSHHWRQGVEGEAATARVLAQLRRSGWTVFHNVEFERHDIDHVLVGPGGVLVLETKWRSEAWQPSSADAKGAMDQLKRNMRTVRLMIQAKAPVPVVGGLVVWTPGFEIPGGSKALGDGAVLLSGHQSKEWVPELEGAHHLDHDTIAAAVEVVADYVNRREARLKQQLSA